MVQILLSLIILFAGHEHRIFAAEVFGHTQIRDSIDGAPWINVSNTRGESANPAVVVCSGRLFVAYEDTLNSFEGAPSIRYGEYQASLFGKWTMPQNRVPPLPAVWVAYVKR